MAAVVGCPYWTVRAAGVQVHRESEEAAQHLVRACENARRDLVRARHRLSRLLLR